jgi:hypothetical protein
VSPFFSQCFYSICLKQPFNFFRLLCLIHYFKSLPLFCLTHLPSAAGASCVSVSTLVFSLTILPSSLSVLCFHCLCVSLIAPDTHHLCIVYLCFSFSTLQLWPITTPYTTSNALSITVAGGLRAWLDWYNTFKLSILMKMSI